MSGEFNQTTLAVFICLAFVQLITILFCMAELRERALENRALRLRNLELSSMIEPWANGR